MRAEEIEASAVGHGGGDSDDAGIFVGELDEGIGEDLGVSGLAGAGLASFRIVGTEAVKLLLAVDGGLKATAFFSEDVEKDGAIFALEEVEGLDEQG